MAVDAAQVDLTHDLAGRTVKPNGADRAVDARREQRFGRARTVRVPKIDDALGGSILPAPGRAAQEIMHQGAHLLFHPDAPSARATHSGYSPTSSVQYVLP